MAKRHKKGPAQRPTKRNRTSWSHNHASRYIWCSYCRSFAETWGNWKLAVQALSRLSGIDITLLHSNPDGGMHIPIPC
jgi:hypothetical protein